MRRELSTRFLLTFSVCLAVAATVFCWRWSSRCSAQVKRYKCEMDVVEDRQAELEHQILGIAAILLKNAETTPHAGRILPSHPAFAQRCRDLLSSPVLRTIEEARADLFLIWYYQKMQKDYDGPS